MKTLVLSAEDVKELLVMRDVLHAVEEGFREYGENRASIVPKVYMELEKGDFRAMPGCAMGSAGIKWVNVHPENPFKRNFPTVMGIIILNDPETGYPEAIMDGTTITKYRTGAAAGIASKYLAKRDSEILGLVGCGAQAYSQFEAIREIFDIDLVKVYDVSGERTESFVKAYPSYNIERCSVEDAVRCDIVSTITPSRSPIVRRKWIENGTHINAMGADAKGKQELEPKILLEGKVVVDDIEQAVSCGEINVSISEGIFSADKIYATLGEIVSGRKKGREGDEITIFDSTGLAIQDIVTARVVFERARKKGLGIEIDFVGTKG
ncbi:MAG: alanine dehydrogenase [Candidatus Syntropharchaeia archaeon]